MSVFDNASLMIACGTGSFDSTGLKYFLNSNLKDLRIVFRDGKKQENMSILYFYHTCIRKRLKQSGFQLNECFVQHESRGIYDYNGSQMKVLCIVSGKVVKIIQNYTGFLNKIVRGKY